MEQRIQKAYASAPKTWLWQLLAAFIVACLLAWSGTAVRVSTPTSNGLEVAKNIISGIFHPSGKLLFTLGTNGVPYLLLETFCIAFLGTIVGAVISLPLSFIYGILPQLTADFTSTIIYRFDMNLRDATVLGLVGAGGIGAPLIFAMSSYRWNEVGAILLGLIVLVLVIEWISSRIRVKLARG